MTPIIEILLADDGVVSYKLHPCSLDTKSYGQVFATLTRQVAKMMHVEGGFPEGKVHAEIIHFLLNELEAQTAEVETRMLQ